LPTVLVAKIAAPVRLDEDLLLRLNLLDMLGALCNAVQLQPSCSTKFRFSMCC